MSIMEPGQEHMPHYVRGLVKRTTGPVQEDGKTCVYLHLQEIEGKLKGTEVALTFRVCKDVSLNALLAQPGDIVAVEWTPSLCTSTGSDGDIGIGHATRFHLSRKVDKAFGDGFVDPKWYPTWASRE